MSWDFPSGSLVKDSCCQWGGCKRCLFNLSLGRSPGGENGNSLQYSCLKNFMDKGAGQAHRVTKSWTRLSNWSPPPLSNCMFSFCNQLLNCFPATAECTVSHSHGQRVCDFSVSARLPARGVITTFYFSSSWRGYPIVTIPYMFPWICFYLSCVFM